MPNKNVFKITSVKVTSNRIDYDYVISGEWKKYFNTAEKLFIEYSIDISKVPQSIAVIPLIGNILPIAWLCNAEIKVPAIDEAFFESIPDFKRGYQEMYKMLSFRGLVSPEVVEKNNQPQPKGCLSLFSGGVDAFNTLFLHINENPTLVTLWGSDVKLDDTKGWQLVDKHVSSVCKEFNLDSVRVKSNFRSFINEGALDELVRESGDGWWHGFQHGLGIITHTAPIAYALNKSSVYIASSFTAASKGVTCASDPSIDNYIRFGSTQVSHDGYEFDRLMKIGNISSFVKRTGHKVRLHVCWQSAGGENCCQCEKCLRTIMGIYAVGDNPQDYGFKYQDFVQLCRYLEDNKWMISAKNIQSRWGPIQREMRSHYTKSEVQPNLRWFYQADLSHFNPYPLSDRIYKKLKNLFFAKK